MLFEPRGTFEQDSIGLRHASSFAVQQPSPIFFISPCMHFSLMLCQCHQQQKTSSTKSTIPCSYRHCDEMADFGRPKWWKWRQKKRTGILEYGRQDEWEGEERNKKYFNTSKRVSYLKKKFKLCVNEWILSNNILICIIYI